jgi:hypothetical protein
VTALEVRHERHERAECKEQDRTFTEARADPRQCRVRGRKQGEHPGGDKREMTVAEQPLTAEARVEQASIDRVKRQDGGVKGQGIRTVEGNVRGEEALVCEVAIDDEVDG